MSYQQGYDPKSLWDTGFFETLVSLVLWVLIYIGIPVLIYFFFFEWTWIGR